MAWSGWAASSSNLRFVLSLPALSAIEGSKDHWRRYLLVTLFLLRHLRYNVAVFGR
jgi:hypothetical protein